ncbi:MAG: ribosome rescue protein RqcH [Candidatus Hydrothermarchaeales archaeon]
MKSEMSSFDIYAALQELTALKGARINKIYQVTPSELKIQLHIKGFGRADLLIEIGRRIHLTEYPRPSPKQPSNFAMGLRKYLGNSKIEDISQVGFDRIVEIKTRGKEGEYTLIAELFGEGNAILADSSGAIKTLMKQREYHHRELKGKRIYEHPPSKMNPFKVASDKIKDLVNESRSDLVRTLALTLGLGGLYAEEVCLRAGIPKGRKDITEEEARSIFDVLDRLKETRSFENSRIILDNEKKIDVTPVPLETYKDKDIKEFDSFNKALDEYFTEFEMEKVEAVVDEKFEDAVGKMQRRLEDQEKVLSRFLKQKDESKKIGDLIYANYNTIEDILAVMADARKRFKEKEISERLKKSKGQVKGGEMIKKYLSKENAVVVAIDGLEFNLNLGKNVGQNADFYYTLNKKTKEKIKGTQIAIEKSKEEIRKIEEEGREAIEVEEKKPKKRVVKKLEWYEKFRWFYSSDGFLVIGGRDASSNEIVVKKHMDRNDVFVHADIHGAPAVVIKSEGKEVPQTTIDDAFEFAAAYSRAWKNNLFALDVYWVKPEQVSKTPEHGEYLVKGAFIVRGKRNRKKASVRAAIGVVINDEAKVIGGPASAVEEHSTYLLRIIPGRKKPKEISKEIKSKLIEMAKKEDEEIISNINIDDIQRFLPVGGHELAKGK